MLKTCPQCARNVIVKEDGICPACDSDTREKGGLSIRQLRIENELESAKRETAYLKKKGRNLIFLGGLSMAISIGLWIYLMTQEVYVKYLVLGAFAGLTILIRGIKKLRDARERKFASALNVQDILNQKEAE